MLRRSDKKLNLFKLSIFIVASLFLMVSIGFLALVWSYSLPSERIVENINASEQYLRAEGPNDRKCFLGICNSLNDITDSHMLTIALSLKGKDAVDKALNDYFPYMAKGKDPSNMKQALHDIFDSPDNLKKAELTSYGRYWHGYLVFLRPLLLIMNYGQIRVLNLFIGIALTFALLVLLYLRGQNFLIVPYALTFLILNPAVIFRQGARF